MELTRTSANHLANIAKEAYQQEENSLKHISFINSYISLLDGNTSKQIKQGKEIEYIASIKDSLTKISKYKYLIAYIREEIKRLDSLEEKMQRLYFDEYLTNLNIELVKPNPINVDSEPDSLKILKYEAYASTFGKFVHPTGEYAKARENAFKIKETPITTDINGKDTIITESTLSIPIETIDNVFFGLQKTQRHYQSTLNKEKYDKEQSEFKAKEEAMSKYKIALEEYNQKYTKYYLEFEQYKAKELEKIRQTKISIPKELEDIVLEIQKLM